MPNFFFGAVSFGVCFVLQFGYTLFPLWLLGFIGLGRCKGLCWCLKCLTYADNVSVSGLQPAEHRKGKQVTRREWIALNRKIQEAVDGLDGACKHCRKQFHEMTNEEAKQHMEGNK